MKAWKRMRAIIGAHLGLPPGELIRGAAKPDEWLKTQYERHNAQVASRVPPNKLLVFNVKEGWAPLCAFLGKPVPNQPFPFVNESAELSRASRIMVTISYSWIPLTLAVAATLHRRRTVRFF